MLDKSRLIYNCVRARRAHEKDVRSPNRRTSARLHKYTINCRSLSSAEYLFLFNQQMFAMAGLTIIILACANPPCTFSTRIAMTNRIFYFRRNLFQCDQFMSYQQ
ncbi:Hypothetical_protein [Hexamita inflata]|uniref:Hypothetical_protein n=1 Tax=Hexamita inflata TaxID=28002 RepID=A0AA86RFA9_9EUKA|nr:Hypothetical protein HINF_LOCUS58869 [Hexamita inflata]